MTKKPNNSQLPTDRLVPKFTLFFFSKPWVSLGIWIALIIFGALSYTTLLKREGFPTINVPLAIVQGSYAVNDPAKVDSEIAQPISDLARKQKGVSLVQAQSSGSFYVITIQYDESVDARVAAKELKQQIQSKANLPASATLNLAVPYFGVTGGDAKKIDALISLYKTTGEASTQQLTDQATLAVAYLNEHKPPLVESFFVQNPFDTVNNPITGQATTIQRTFDRYGEKVGKTSTFYNSVGIGVTGPTGVDVIKLDAQIQQSLNDLAKQSSSNGYTTRISASNAPQIKEEIGELQRVLLEGLVAVLIIGSIVIAVRASIITVVSMVTVIMSVIGLLYLLGYSLNVITLFGLILGLSLIVDDTIIMVEAIDAARRKTNSPKEAVQIAVTKISRAMVAATTTAALCFAPLLFVSGILGSFIHAIPVTIISALFISLLVALVFIPLFARVLLLGKKQMGEQSAHETAANFEAKIATAICKPMLWARGSTKKLLSVGLVAVLIGTIFIGSAGFIFGKVTFNIFPPTKDTNALSVSLAYPPNTTIEQAEVIAANADKLVSDTIGENYVSDTYYGLGSAASSMAIVNITPYGERAATSPELVKQLQGRFDKDFPAASATIGQLDVGPPTAAFTVQVQTNDREKGYKLAGDIKSYLAQTTLKRVSGKTAHFKNVSTSSPGQYIRNKGVPTINVTANFDGDDTTTLVTLAQDAVKKEYTASKLASYGLPKDAVVFDLGQESENQNSFKALALAFPILLLVIYLLLLLEFRSFLQPLLIFLAIPFSLFGVTLGLYLTHNAFSFFAAMGFFALIGLSLKNTILLTDYANQSRKAGMGAIDAAVAALGERFRPLVATSLTAVVSLIPLAVTSPFWEGLAVVLIFGLLSSTTLVILVFPYYYLGGEFLRAHISRKAFFLWLIPTIALIFALGKINGKLWPLAILLTLAAAIVLKRRRKSAKSAS
ncbi:efflux RND transporter permease subunit [Aeromicrobium sp.]|nr:efflux RND transporter permease subunit [Candidatus Saccharibacteria bacterium]